MTNFSDQWPKAISNILEDLIYSSYCTQRDSGLTHPQCMSIGLGQESYQERYLQDKDPNDLEDVRFGLDT